MSANICEENASWRWIEAERLPPGTGKFVPRPVSEDDLARRRSTIDWLCAHRVSIAPLTTADLIHKVREQQRKRDAAR